MVITDIDARWSDLLREIDSSLGELVDGASVGRVTDALWRIRQPMSSSAFDVYVEAQDPTPDDPFDDSKPERVLVVTRVMREVSREELSAPVVRRALVDAADGLYLRPCARLHPDGSRKLVLAATHTLYLSTLDKPELAAVIGEARNAYSAGP